MLLMAIALLASEPAPKAECGYWLSVAAAAREVYLDPSPATRSRATRQLVAEMLVPLRRLDEIGKQENQDCLEILLKGSATFVDSTIFQEELAKQAAVFRTQRQRLRVTAPGLRISEFMFAVMDDLSLFTGRNSRPFWRLSAEEKRERVVEARIHCAPPPDRQDRSDRQDQEDRCSMEHLFALARTRDPVVSALLLREDVELGAGLRAALRTWAQLPADQSSRLTTLASLVALGTGDDEEWWTSEDWFLHQLAEDELLGDPDPRRWEPESIAILLSPLVRSSAGMAESVEVLETLLPMGFERTCDLVNSFRPAARAIPCKPERVTSRHFPFEFEFYESEWARKSGIDVTKTPSFWPADAERLEEMESFVRAKWSETDRNAPHPDMKKLREALLTH